MSQGSTNDNSRFTRFPAIKVFIEDLNEGNWDFEENILESRYGKIKRVKMCGTVLNKKEVVEEQQEDSFLMDEEGPKSRISYEIDDGTDRLWGTIWNVDVEDYKSINEGTSVDLVGIVRIYNNRIQVTLDYIKELKDPNFESYHRIEVVKKRLLEPQHEITKTSQMGATDFDFEMPEDDFGFIEEEIEETPEKGFNTESQDETTSQKTDLEQTSNVGENIELNESNITSNKLDLADQIQNY